MDMQALFRDNYLLLARLFDGSLDVQTLPEAAKSEVTGYMALNFDKLRVQGHQVEIALSHYFQVGGDSVADPDMELRIDLQTRTVEAIAYQDSYGYRRVHGAGGECNEREHRSQNLFLSTWLRNCLAQGHTFKSGASG